MGLGDFLWARYPCTSSIASPFFLHQFIGLPSESSSLEFSVGVAHREPIPHLVVLRRPAPLVLPGCYEHFWIFLD